MTEANTAKNSAASAGNDTKTEFDAEELVALARLDIEQNRLDRALGKLKRALTYEDVPAEGFAAAARVYGQLGLYERAKGLFAQFLEREPGAVLESFQLGMTHYDAGETDQALAVWENLLLEQPVHPPALFYKGLVLAQSGQPADALQTLDVLLKSAPADNLYFGRAKELKKVIERDGTAAAVGGSAASASLPPNAYQTEH